MSRHLGKIAVGLAALTIVGVCLGVSLLTLRYGAVLIHALRTGNLADYRPDRPQPRFVIMPPAQTVLPCDAVSCELRFDGGQVLHLDDPTLGDPLAAPPFTGHFRQRQWYRVGNGNETSVFAVAVAYHPSGMQNRMGDDVDTTESWEHLAPGVNFAPLKDRLVWAGDGYDLHLFVTSHDGRNVRVDIRQLLGPGEVACNNGVVLFGPDVRRDALLAAIDACLEP